MICHAPFNNIYFNTQGQASPCWKLPGYVDDWSNNRSINDIWNGDKFNKYRDALSKDIFLDKCKECKKDIDNGVWPLAQAYNEYPINDNGYPSMLELEVSNKCNLECIMCSPLLSSGLAKRTGLGLLEPYENTFREQLKEYYPHLKELRFNGGEPFAQQMVLDICDDVSTIRPDLPISIATNGTVFNKVVRHLMEVCALQINVSIDSLIPERYSTIRVNGKLDKVMKNFEHFKKYCEKYDRQLSVMVNPMRNNWEEMPKFLDFVEEHNCKLWYNTIVYPENLSIWKLPSETLNTIYNTLSKECKERTGMAEHHKLNHLVESQIKTWLLDSYV